MIQTPIRNVITNVYYTLSILFTISDLSSNITSSQLLLSSAAIEVVTYNRKNSAMY
jgi:hypothetical protein